MNLPTAGEQLFSKYLSLHGMEAEREPTWPHTKKRPDFRYDHPNAGAIVIELKDIELFPPITSGAFDSYFAIRTHIQSALPQFSDFSAYVCILVLYALYPSPLVDLSSPRAMLGAMYGNLGFTLPFNPEKGHLDQSRVSREFLIGEGKMVRPSGRKRNTRIAALVTLHNYNVQAMKYSRYMRKPQSYLECLDGSVAFEEEIIPGVTVWENAVAKRKLPRDLFRGPMDQWWAVEDDKQELAYVGSQLADLRT